MVAVVIGFDCGRAGPGWGGRRGGKEAAALARHRLLRVEGAKRRRSRQPKGGIKGPRTHDKHE